MKQFSINLSDKTLHYLNQLQLPNRSDYIEELILKEWAAKDCGHFEPEQDCPNCYARDQLLNRKPRKDLSENSSLQLLKQHLSTTWLTDANFARTQKILQANSFSPRQLVAEEQQAIFLRVPFTYWGVYLAGLTLTLDRQLVFGAKDVRTRLQGLLGELWDKPGAKAGSVLPSDASEGSKYAGGYDCLRIVDRGKRPTYCWVGFRTELPQTIK